MKRYFLCATSGVSPIIKRNKTQLTSFMFETFNIYILLSVLLFVVLIISIFAHKDLTLLQVAFQNVYLSHISSKYFIFVLNSSQFRFFAFNNVNA